jgi:hypothetical protein
LQAQHERDLRELGLDNPPEWIQNNPEAMSTFLVAVNEGWSPERTWMALSDTAAFKARYPGLDVVMAQTGSNSFVDAINEYHQRESEITASLLRHRGPNTDISLTTIDAIVATGWNPANVEELAEVEAQIRNDPTILENLNAIYEFQGLDPISADVLADILIEGNRIAAGVTLQDRGPLGQAPLGPQLPSDVFRTFNDAMRLQALITAGVDVSLQTAIDLGDADTGEEILSPAQFTRQAQLAAQEIDRNRRDIDLEKFGLTEAEITAASFGEPIEGGRDVTEIQELILKLSRERQRAATGTGGATSFQDAEGRLRLQGFRSVT